MDTIHEQIPILLREGAARARTTALRDALAPEELRIRARRCLKKSRRLERSGNLRLAALMRGFSRGYKEASSWPFLGLDRR